MLVLAAAHEVGGANALVPVIHELKSRKIRVDVLASGKAPSVFSESGIEHKKFAIPNNFDDSLEELRRIFALLSPDALLLGTAWGLSIDKVLLRLGNIRGVPSVSVVDMWSNYLERFVDPFTSEQLLPSKVALMDDVALRQAIEAGLHETVLEVTGQPYLESLRERIREPEIVSRSEELRHEWLDGVCSQGRAKIALFVSERILQDFGPETQHYRGYSELDALEGLLKAVRFVEEMRGVQVRVVVKLHPEEHLESSPMKEVIDSERIVVARGAPWPCVLAADVVVGMTSMLLIESVFAKKPTISFQPGVEDRGFFIGTLTGATPLASSTDELVRELETAFIGGMDDAGLSLSEAVPEFIKPGSIKRIADLLMKLAQCHAHQNVSRV